MPLYEYRCHECEKVFILAISLKDRYASETRCPGCNSKKVTQVFGSINVRTDKKI